MPNPVQIELLPLGQTIAVEPDTPLQDVLFEQGVEFPCGGRGRCQGCRVKVLAGQIPVSDEDQRLLSPEALADGWRLACRAHATEDLKLELAQWEATILADNTEFHFEPQDGLGIAVDLGTTTLVVQLLDLRTGKVLAVRTGLNEQARHGADLMSRIDFAIAKDGQSQLQSMIRQQILRLIQETLNSSGRSSAELKNVVLVGNTVMHHLFCGVSVDPLAHHPFEPEDDGPKILRPEELGWQALQPSKSEAGQSSDAGPAIHFLSCLGGFVGSDVLAGILATKMHESEELVGIVDLGTNGEIVVGNRDKMLCTSTAAGPAFEGARIAMGMRAATGAIAAVSIKDNDIECNVLGHGSPRGLCGSGLVDAVAAGLELGRIHMSGRFIDGKIMPLSGPVELTQADIRELQLAKGAIAAGIRLLAEQWREQMSDHSDQQWGGGLEDVTRIYLAGAFGNYINRQSAYRIGLIPFGPEKVVAAGNTALIGAKLALFGLNKNNDSSYADLCKKVEHVSLKEDPLFQQVFVEEMIFPDVDE